MAMPNAPVLLQNVGCNTAVGAHLVPLPSDRADDGDERESDADRVPEARIATAVLCFIFAWNEFLFAFMLGGKAVQTLPVSISKLITAQGVRWGEMAIVGMVALLPIVAVADVARQAVREMVKHVCARTNLSRNQAYMLRSLAGNLRVTQTVDGDKGVHMLLEKALI